MAGRSQIPEYVTDSPLSRNQQDLLLAALNSQGLKSSPRQSSTAHSDTKPPKIDTADDSHTMSISNGAALLVSPQDDDLDGYGVDFTPDLDYLDGDSFDFENADLGGDMIGALPGSGGAANAKLNGDVHEKRKNPDDSGGSEEGDAKRQETQEGERQAKKPGRKPLTNEPTTKRKAQNRAAQRAFRERKEKHLKDLETQVSDLTKASEADKHENGLLKAQVERLQAELREYRKRLSLTSSTVSRSPPLNATNSQGRSNSNPSYGNGFQFDFPKFGGLPGSQILSNAGMANSGILRRDSTTPPTHSPTNVTGYTQPPQSQTSRQSSMGRSMSPPSNQGSMSSVASPSQFANLNPSLSTFSTPDNMHGFTNTLPQMNGSSDPFNDLFSPSILKSTSPTTNYFDNPSLDHEVTVPPKVEGDNGNDSTSGLSRVFQFNSGSVTSETTSPSASSASLWNTNGTVNSSCGTSPEPSLDSPAVKDSEKMQSPQFFDASSMTNIGHNGQSTTDTKSSMPSLVNFDPVLFGDYRDSNEAVVGAGDFSGGFFDDALNQTFDMGSPSNLFGILQSPQQTHASLEAPGNASTAPAPSKNLMAEVEKTRDSDDYGLSSTARKQTSGDGEFVSCNKIWNQLQSNRDFQEGKFDLDGLCSELRTKARCSESGVLVEQNHVDAALRKLGQKDENGKAYAPPASLMFELESWDRVLHKMREGKQ